MFLQVNIQIHIKSKEVIQMLGLPKGQVFLVPWTEQWEVEFTEEAMKIRNELKGDIQSIHHIGSTAIKGLRAKPIIDIAIEVESFEKGERCIPGLERVGYSYKGTNILPDRHYFSKGEPRTHQIHMYPSGSEYLHKQLLFRDYLISNVEARTAYQQLKEALAKANSTDKLAYADAKTEFIRRVVSEAESTDTI
ncbi:hypothetical protein PAECIP111890_03034 [Paenibacillus sp. JJ-223]|nr:hypothetical protein PAECIP111890_03034 [Paenibacillus sp. JJ-223]